VRPQLCLSVATASATNNGLQVAEGAAAAIELLHCASLVHDDLPCFDDADVRRGRASVHSLHGQPLAVLAGDALIVESFNTVSRACIHYPERLAPLITCLVDAVGMPSGIVAGQAWESEENVDVTSYHRAKTGSLFVGAVTAGAIAVGADPTAWRPLGDCIGRAYQLADDLLDAAGKPGEADKKLSQDARLERPNAVNRFGIDRAMQMLKDTVSDAAASIPECHGAAELRALIVAQATRLVPKEFEKARAAG